MLLVIVYNPNLSSTLDQHEKHCSNSPLYIEMPVLSFPVDIFRRASALGQYCLASKSCIIGTGFFTFLVRFLTNRVLVAIVSDRGWPHIARLRQSPITIDRRRATVIQRNKNDLSIGLCRFETLAAFEISWKHPSDLLTLEQITLYLNVLPCLIVVLKLCDVH